MWIELALTHGVALYEAPRHTGCTDCIIMRLSHNAQPYALHSSVHPSVPFGVVAQEWKAFMFKYDEQAEQPKRSTIDNSIIQCVRPPTKPYIAVTENWLWLTFVNDLHACCKYCPQ